VNNKSAGFSGLLLAGATLIFAARLARQGDRPARRALDRRRRRRDDAPEA
jgi:hypothetical protein